MNATRENTKTLFEKNPPYKSSSDVLTINQIFDNWSKDMKNNTLYTGIVSVGTNSHPLGGGTWSLIGDKAGDLYEWQIVIKYDTKGIRIFARCKVNGSWQSWAKK